MSPSRSSERVEYSVGYTAWGQKLRLVGERDYMGKWLWSLHQDQLNLRDEANAVRGLSAENIRKMLAAVEEDGR